MSRQRVAERAGFGKSRQAVRRRAEIAVTARVLIFVEDPGAANFAAPLAAALGESGIDVIRLAAGHASAFLSNDDASWATPDDDADAILSARRPDAVLVGTSENHCSLAHRLVEAAGKRRLRTAALIDGLANATHRFSGGDAASPLRHCPDWLLVPDAAVRNAYLELGLSDERAIVVGHPYFDVVRRRACDLDPEKRATARRALLPAIAPDRPVVTFLAEVNDGLDPAGYRRTAAYTLRGRGSRDDRTGIVLEEVLDACAGLHPRPALVLRPHPKNAPGDFGGLKNEVDAVIEAVPIFDLLAVSAVAVGMTSMPLTEAVLMGVPALSVLPRAIEAQWLSCTALGLVPVAATRDEVAPSIASALGGANQPAREAVDSAFPHGAIENAAAAVRRMLGDGSERPVIPREAP